MVTGTDKFSGDIAIVGMSLCVPGAASTSEFWRNLRDGVESIQPLSEEALLAAGEDPALLADPNYVPSAALLERFADFDAEFFGFSPKEAAILDPQHRKFLEVAWEAMEDAGHPPESIPGAIGVYAGCGMGSYFYFNICSNPGLVDETGMFLLRHTGNDKDFLSTRVSHVFDLKGPSINIQTACSTSLVAIHYGCKALRDGEVDMALAGGVTIELPQGRGYLYKENEILSPGGHCHAFDHRAQGTVFGSGSGAVALRRLEDAVADGDHIWAVIKGSAVNNDGAAKAGYLAPSVDGQAAAVQAALKDAKVTPDTIDYVECHGTGTYLGDPIEISALTEAYRTQTDDIGYCRVGSVKTNIGHLDTAAGIAGLAKATLGLHHEQIPPSLGYEAPNPAIDFETSPFKVNDALRDWTSHRGPRRAAVNALGVGGTNAHTILEQAPDRGASEESDFPFHVLCLSARSRAALDANAQQLAEHLRANPDLDLADVAFTLKEGRRAFEKRRVLVAETPEHAAEMLANNDPQQVFTHDALPGTPDTVFMFPGGGAQYAGMARDLYETEPVFADWMDRGLEHLQKQLDYDIRAIWLPEGDTAEADAKLTRPSVQLPLIMIVEYALAQLWVDWGVKPAALVGHSMGENTAACLAGVISFEDCIDLILLRGRLFDTVPAGGMLSISLPLTKVEALIGDDLDIASVNAPRLTAVSGPQEALDQLAETLVAQDVDHQRIAIDIAAHSRMLEPILADYRAFLQSIVLNPPQMQVLSNRTGQVLTAEQATDPDYWVGQLRNTVHFADCIDTLADTPARVFLEVGPGKALSSLAQMADAVSPGQVLSSLRHPDQNTADDAYFLQVIGRLWACGVNADWAQIWGEAKRHRLPLPTYAFQRSRYFIEPGTQTARATVPALKRAEDLNDWGWRPAWRPRLAECDVDVETELDETTPLNWLIFEDDAGVAAPAIERLTSAGHSVTRVRAGDTYAKLGEDLYQVPPEQGRHGYDSLLHHLTEADRLPDRIGHFWLVTRTETFRPGHSFYDRNMEQGFLSLTSLAQALTSVELPDTLHIAVFTTGAAQVRGEALPYPEKATIAGPAGVLPHEMPGVTCATIDIDLPEVEAAGFWSRGRKPSPLGDDGLTNRILEELLSEPGNTVAALRGNQRFGQSYKRLPLDAPERPVFTDGGTYLITGGFGGIGLTLAADLMRNNGANVVLLSRDALPATEEWDNYLRSHSPNDRIARRIAALRQLQGIKTGQVMAVAADVCNIDQMRAAAHQAEERFGALNGVIHAAGHIADSLIATKSEAEIQQVLAPKVNGLQVLNTLFPDGMLELMVLFASSSTATRPAGQVDYVAANEYLNAWARSRRNAATRVVAVNWGVWADVGMAADAMSARTGGAQPTEREVIELPLLDEMGFDADGNRIFVSAFSLDEHWVLDEHRTRDGTALMPGTGYIELAAQALKAHGITVPYEVRDLFFFRPLEVKPGQPRETLVRLEQKADTIAFTVHSSTGDGYVLNAQATLTLLPEIAPEPVVLSQIAARCPKTETAPAEGRLRSPQERHLNFGPRWHVVRSTAFGDGEGVARLVLPDVFGSDLVQGYQLHPGLMDLATGWAISLVDGYDNDALWVPVSYRSLRVHAALPADLRSWVRLSPEVTPIGGFASFNVTLFDAQGAVCVEIEGFQMKRLTEALNLEAPETVDATAAYLGLIARGMDTPLSPEEQRLHRQIAQGIRAEEGPEALRRAIAAGCPQVVLSSLDLQGLIQQADAVSESPTDEGQSFERPNLDTEYVAPETEIEKTLAGFFETLLGVSQVGTQDSFFDLGGHSLIAVRLFAQINRTYQVEFPISVLFEAPSVARIAERIAARVGDVSTPGEGSTTSDQPNFKHLVPLHQGEQTTATPFFLVAGMGGNVLNLRHLALMLGRDRPVFGLQARGLIGDEDPHHDLVDAARAYVEELRQVQPHGPYMLSGFSGGGITAYEMAQQLKAAGEEVSVLALLDSPLPVRPSLSRPDKALIKLHEFKRKGPGYFSEWARNRWEWELRKRNAPRPEENVATAFNNVKVELAFRAAIEIYQVKPWDGPLTLFRPPLDKHWKVSGGKWVSSEREYVFADNDWGKWAPKIEVVEVTGDHDSMVLVPNVSVLAEKLRSYLDQADARHSGKDGAWSNATAAE
ncbi:Phthiocerol/phenolphthiocerol synthesis polyketide synthase type I PpsE [Falsiruegeria litorea R37]|uniref:Phenolphthiocerol/phthiocerol polyketide synthase subunit E n=1 Tax=Falsiruegeria litorea R37 TaxID=1200284 RepID=A0A1Y5T613_9RHOB|nr:type I polyketide synthase [Falsiruegeria litorea]SLN53350.1 Phthiocerol/phenolphthiocerol synthesis polyketide synthase type I PpsE [Falsiruegeria litorea R37]